MNQRQAVLAYLKTGKHITSKDAFELFGATRLSAIIFDLRKMGYKINMIKREGITRFGKKTSYGEYFLEGDSYGNKL